ncbi:MAG TPA: VCBS repeat-containing protein [Phycisphaerae bacterium]|nr:VCBS repeat-containing protein [Phycisphaerae bacterium]HNU44166.1 VCBS repeat-containing protein [Phycisphaerae bacterium]
MQFGKSCASVLMLALCLVSTALAQTIFPATPDWESADRPYSTGGALVDLNRDGWLDFVVANGNDMARQRLVVYYNNGNGTFPANPNWNSGDLEYNGHISIADVNGDGWDDVAVALTQDGYNMRTARLYLNNQGTLSSLPDWVSADTYAAFHVAFGDVNGDGRPDLAVGTGFPYSGSHVWRNYVYYNVNGTLETLPSWVSADTYDYMDIFFCDVDRDGRQDLVGVGTNTHTRVYRNNAGVLATTSTWTTLDNSGQFSVMGTYGDVNADGWFELLVTDNTQLFAGSGYFRRYDGLIGGLFSQYPTWSYYEGYGSAVALADLDADGDLDLATGGWWDYTRYFLGTAGAFPPFPSWSSSGTSVVEAICFGDVDNDALRSRTQWYDVSGTPGRHLFHLPHQPVQWIEAVNADGSTLTPAQYTCDLVHGWVSIGPAAGQWVSLRYAYSLKPDMAITNWDNQGNYLYYNRNSATRFGDANDDDSVDLDDFLAFVACLTGPGPMDPPPSTACRRAFDADGDADVDMADFRELTIVLAF